MATSAHHSQADDQIEHINCSIGQILHRHLLYEDQEHYPD